MLSSVGTREEVPHASSCNTFHILPMPTGVPRLLLASDASRKSRWRYQELEGVHSNGSRVLLVLKCPFTPGNMRIVPLFQCNQERIPIFPYIRIISFSSGTILGRDLWKEGEFGSHYFDVKVRIRGGNINSLHPLRPTGSREWGGRPQRHHEHSFFDESFLWKRSIASSRAEVKRYTASNHNEAGLGPL